MSDNQRRIIVAGNWKMNTTLSDAIALAKGVVDETRGANADILIVPPACFLGDVARVVANTHIALGAQNIHPGEFGAKTGEVSGPMLRSLGVTHVLCGHSERRHIFGESDEWIGEKVSAAHAHGLIPVLCVGETLEDRDQGNTESVVGRQLETGIAHLSEEDVSGTIIAYEPVWAIGTGRTATPEQAQDVHAFIRGRLAGRYGDAVASRVRIQYGGSVKPANAQTLLNQRDIDGALVGGASLNAESFAAIAQAPV